MNGINSIEAEMLIIKAQCRWRAGLTSLNKFEEELQEAMKVAYPQSALEKVIKNIP